ncbi:MAG: hypothetical protein IIU46_09185 [Treponema sp.]|nr:hypothetical protein [Treponema sp.]
MYDNGNYDPSFRYDRYRDDRYDGGQSILPKVLFIIMILVVVTFVLGTIIAFATKKGNIGHEYRRVDPSPEKVVNRSQRSSSRLKTSALGQIRISMQPDSENEKGAMLVVSPWFSYPEDDVQLDEEIFQKDRLIKSLISTYFSSRSKKTVLSTGEKKVKEEIRDSINSQLVMGEINALYFDEYMFFELNF